MSAKDPDENNLKVHVEYCGVCDYGGHCLALANKIRDQTPGAVVFCKRGRQGAFEVAVNDKLIYSKLKTMALPDYEEVSQVVNEVSEGGEAREIIGQQPVSFVGNRFGNFGPTARVASPLTKAIGKRGSSPQPLSHSQIVPGTSSEQSTPAQSPNIVFQVIVGPESTTNEIKWEVPTGMCCVAVETPHAIQRVQNACARFCFDVPTRGHATPFLNNKNYLIQYYLNCIFNFCFFMLIIFKCLLCVSNYCCDK